MFTILITIHILVCFGLIISVLMQSAKGEGLAGAFGGGGVSGAVFGGRGAAPFLSKATTALAIMFMGMCILLTLTTGGGRSGAIATGSSAVQDYARDQAQQVTPTDVPEVNVGQPAEGQPQQDLPITVTPTPTTQTEQGQQKEKPPEGSGGE